jgi:hypothetical protein
MWKERPKIVVRDIITNYYKREPAVNSWGRGRDVKGNQVYRQVPMFSASGPDVNLSSEVLMMIIK